jgi:hypothetical protein
MNSKATATALVVILSLLIVLAVLFIYWLVLRADRDLYGQVLADDNKSLDWEQDNNNTSNDVLFARTYSNFELPLI